MDRGRRETGERQERGETGETADGETTMKERSPVTIHGKYVQCSRVSIGWL